MNSYYNDTLYPLQDNVLKQIASANTPFYLTGGTALSRGYFNHRYSDDLDLFINADPKFLTLVDLLIHNLQDTHTISITHRSNDYISLRVNNILKVEFVNDVAFHSGIFETKDFFPRIDNLTNILSNKLAALISHDEPKDVVDIWVIAKNMPVNWSAIFQDVNSKAVGIFPPDIAKRLVEFPLDLIDLIKWTPGYKPTLETLKNDLSQICTSILA